MNCYGDIVRRKYFPSKNFLRLQRPCTTNVVLGTTIALVDASLFTIFVSI